MADQRVVEGPQFVIARIEQGREPARGEDRVHAKLRASGMRGLAFGADERAQTTFVSCEDRVVGRLADNDQVGSWLLLRESPRAAAVNLLVGDEHHDQRAAPVVPLQREETAGLGHGHDRSLGVTSASAEQLAVALRQTKRIAGPAAADRNGVHMRVESETGSLAIVDSSDDIGAAVRNGTNLRGEADGLELGRKQGGGLDLPSRRVLRVDRDEPLKQASEPSDVGGIQVLDKQLSYSFEVAGAPARILSATDRGPTTAA